MIKTIEQLKKEFPDRYKIVYDFGDGEDPVVVGEGTVDVLNEIPGSMLCHCTPDDKRGVMTGPYIEIDEPSEMSKIPFDFTQVIKTRTMQILDKIIQHNKSEKQ